VWSRRSRENEDLVRQRLRTVWPGVATSDPRRDGGFASQLSDDVLDDDSDLGDELADAGLGLADRDLDRPGFADRDLVWPGLADRDLGGVGVSDRDLGGSGFAGREVGGAGIAGGGGPAGGRGVLGAFDPGRRGLRALLVVAAVVVVVAGYLFWRGQPRVEAAPGAPTATVPGSPADPSAPAGTILVAVTGRVVHPGLVRLPDGARVQDALAAAGGVLPGTDISFLNLARKLTDGELLVVGVSPPPQAVDGAAAGTAAGAGRVNINTGTVAELDTLPGIGPALAQRIVDYRAAHGPFHSIDELRKVSGIGDAKFAEIKDRVTV
jgi:competence protein ComEA